MKIRLRGPLTKPAAADGCLDESVLSRHTGAQTNNELIQLTKGSLAIADECLTEKFHNNEDVNQLVKARAWVVTSINW